MKYSPSNSELENYLKLSKEERFNYCLVRITEAEEVWGLAEPQGWIINEVEEQATLPIWPYQQFAVNSARKPWQDASPQAISLEHFVYKVSQLLIDNGILVEIFPTATQPGHVIEAKAFFNILENMMESGEYFMEG